MSWRTHAALAALFGCSVPNQDHCSVNDGDASCKQRGDDRPYCSKCVGENNGCVFEPVSDPMCAAATGGGSTTATPGSTGVQSTDSGGPTTSTTTPTETTGPGPTTGPTTGTSGTTTTSTGPDTTGDPSTTTTTMTTEPGTSTTGTTGPGTTDTTGPDTTSTTTTMGGSDTEPGGKCGNGFLEGQENCDGINFGGETCQSLNTMYGGGTLSCTDMCQISYENCCYKAGVTCANNSECCPGLTCKLGLPAKCG